MKLAGRHLRVVDRRLAFGDAELPSGDILGFAALRGPLEEGVAAEVGALAAVPITVLAVGRWLELEDAFARFS